MTFEETVKQVRTYLPECTHLDDIEALERFVAMMYDFQKNVPRAEWESLDKVKINVAAEASEFLE